MTMRRVPFGGAWKPYPIVFNGSSATINGLGLNFCLLEGETTRVAYTLICPVSGTLDMFEFWMDYGSSDAGTTLKISFQDLDSNGFPDGTADQYRVVTLGDIVSSWVTPGLMTSDGTDGGAKRTVTRGQKIAAVIEFDTSNAGDEIAFGLISPGDDGTRRMHAGGQTYSGGWWQINGIAVGILRYDNPAYFPMPECVPTVSLTQTTINTGTTPDEVGIEFSVPFDMMIGGASFCLSGATNNAGWDAVLYDPSGVAIETVAMKLYTDLFASNGYTYWTVKFSNDKRITANEIWRVTVKPSSATSVKLLEISFNDTAMLEDLYWNGSPTSGTDQDVSTNNISYMINCRRTDGGDWSSSGILLPLISLHVTGIEQVTGGATDDWTGDA